MTGKAEKDEITSGEENYIGNIWGRKWTIVSLIVILFFLSLAVCRYVVVKPDRLIHPDSISVGG